MAEEKYNDTLNNILCKKCYNLLYEELTEDKLLFVCKSCNSKYETNKINTLIYEETKKKNIDKYTVLIKNILYDKLNPKILKKCNKCDNKYAIKIRLNDGKEFLMCNSCKAKI